MKKCMAFFLALIVSIMSCATALAEDVPSDLEVLGHSYDDIGLLEEEPLHFGNGACDPDYTTNSLFSMTVSYSPGLITTKPSNKYFYGYSLSVDRVWVTGTLTNSASNSANIKYGVCIYLAYDDTFDTYSGWYGYVQSGHRASLQIYKSSLQYSYPFYGFVNNGSNSGYAYGSLAFYNTDDPRAY